jgi:HD-GYP domain-containing protein (c-di-GMP phosphodiesterase class II)
VAAWSAFLRAVGDLRHERGRRRAAAADPAAEQLVEASRARLVSRLTVRERRAHTGTALLFVAVAVPLALLAPTNRHPSWTLEALLVLCYAVASRIDFEVGAGVAVPSQLVLVPMLFTLPAGRIPLAVAAATVLAQLPNYVLRRATPQRLAVTIANAAYSLAPAAVFLAWSEPAAALGSLPVLAAALAAQFAADTVISTGREWFALRLHPSVLWRPLAWAFAVDLLLAPVGFAAVLGSRTTEWALFLPLPLLALLRLFASERAGRLDKALELSAAYRSTALLLGDMVEAENANTGFHSRQVVALTTAVCEKLGLDAYEAQLAEFTALLHDAGKMKIPPEILNKPGPLNDEERALMRQHTIEGENMLRPVGGLLAEIGGYVRSCHERFDGRGYPDRLAEDEIPLVSRIVCCCDAYDAMRSTRPYREALSAEEARAELIRCVGTHFDPVVVRALLDVIPD